MKSVMRAALVGGLAILALSAVTTASASAYTNPILVNSKGEHVSKVKFTGKSIGTGGLAPVLTPGGAKWGCDKETSTAELSTTGSGSAAVTSGTEAVIFTGCTQGGNGCSNTKTVGQIESKLSISFVWVGKESEEKPGIESSIAPMSGKPGNGEGAKLKYECAEKSLKYEAEGAFIASLSRKLAEEFTYTSLSAQQTDGEQRYKKYTTEGKEEANTLYSNLNGGTFVESAAELEEEQAFGEKVKIVKS
jgi:hypothetical protein